MLTELLSRHVVIPAFETLYKRRRTFQYYRELERSQWRPLEEIRDHQFQALLNLLRHAQKNCTYYQELWSDLGLNPAQLSSLEDFSRFPLLEKRQIREFAVGLAADNFRGELMSKSTGGSTGVPLQIKLDRGSHERRTAAMWRGYGWAGAAPGTKQFFLWGVPVEERATWRNWKDDIYNRILRRKVFSAFDLTDAVIPEVARQIAQSRPDAIVAYTSALYSLAKGLQARGIRPYSPRSIVVGAEKLHDFQRETIESVFGAPVFETYGCREFMMIGGECEEHRGLHLTLENLHVEIVNDDGTPTAQGEVGNVVVTDLFNYGMPMIRYVTGDQAVAGFGQCRCGRSLPTLSAVQGRRVDTLRTADGRSIPGAFFPHLMKDFAGVRQFQVVQRSLSELQLKVVLGPEWRESEQGVLLQRVRKTVGDSVRLDWSPVQEIPLTQAGKHRVVVSEVH
jgi:phenylacetate-CoA ligase